MRRPAIGLTAVALVALSGIAQADDAAPFSERAHTVLVLDNLGGWINSNSSHPDQPGTQDQGANTFGLFPFSPVARFGIHQFVAGGLSLGGAIIYSYEKLNVSLLGSLGGSTTFGLAPRIGYAIPLGPTTAIWLRAGFSYTHSSDANDDGSSWQLSPGGEAFLVVAPVPHFGITVGPYGEFGVAGKQTSCSSNNGSNQGCTDQTVLNRYFGLTFGVLADF